MAETDLAPSASDHNKKLFKLARKRLERFVSLLPKVLVSDDPEVIHDLRVSSRRFQQATRVILPQPNPLKPKKVIRALRRVRQALGPCRNLDVNLALIAERRRQSGTAIVRRSWEALQGDLEERRDPLLEQARQEIAQVDLFAFIERAQTLIDAAKRAADERAAEPVQKLAQATVEAMKTCDEACAQSYEAREPSQLHRFRLAAKRMRYRVELLADLGQVKAKPLLIDLKELQTALGDWHDRCVLLQSIAEFIGRPDFLAQHPDMGRILLAEMEKDKLCNEANVAQLFEKAAKMRQSWAEWKSKVENTSATAPNQ